LYVSITVADIPGPGSYDPKLAMIEAGDSPNIRCGVVKSASITKDLKRQLHAKAKLSNKVHNLRSEDLFRTRPQDVYRLKAYA